MLTLILKGEGSVTGLTSSSYRTCEESAPAVKFLFNIQTSKDRISAVCDPSPFIIKMSFLVSGTRAKVGWSHASTTTTSDVALMKCKEWTNAHSEMVLVLFSVIWQYWVEISLWYYYRYMILSLIHLMSRMSDSNALRSSNNCFWSEVQTQNFPFFVTKIRYPRTKEV